MNSYKKTKKIFILFTVLFAFSTLSVLFGFLYIKNDIELTNEKSQEIKSQLSTNYRLMSTPKIVEDLKVKDKIIEEMLISESEIIYLIEKFESFAEQKSLDLKIETVNFKKDEKGGPILEIILRSSGNFSRNLEFLNIIENIPYYLKVNSVRFEQVGPANTESSGSNLSISFIIFAR